MTSLNVLPAAGAGRKYMCDSTGHFVHVLDGEAQPLFSFGGFGERPGQFNEPSDIAVVSGDSRETVAASDVALIAVADRGNHRVQIFDPDGVLIAVLASRPQSRDWRCRSAAPWGAVWVQVPDLTEPSRLAWSAPFLEVETANERVVRVNLGAELSRGLEAHCSDADSKALWTTMAHHPLAAYFTSYAVFRSMTSSGRPWTRQ